MPGRSDVAPAHRAKWALVLAFLATHAIFRLWLGFDLFVAFHRVASDAAAFNEDTGRPYGVWVRQNLIDFLFSCGVCHLVLDSYELLDVAGLPTTIEAVGDPGDFYEPDYGND